MKKHCTIFLIALLVFTAFTIGAAQPALKDFFKNNFLIGGALNEAQFSEKNNVGAEIAKKHFNTITPENVLKWEIVHPQPGKYDFSASDKFIEFGEKNNMVIIGHTLVWHAQTPKWVFEDSSGKPLAKEKLLERMRDHIYTVVGRYKGKIKGWDVVNEAIVDDGSYNQSPWFKIIGEEFVVKAFQFAHEADPNAELYYNDFSAENIPKRNGVIALVEKLQSLGIPVSGIGMQGHYNLSWPSLGQIDSTIKEFGQLGVTVMVTELDMDVLPLIDWSSSADISRRFEYRESMNPYKTGLPDSVQQALAQRYKDIFSVFVKNGNPNEGLKPSQGCLSRVTFWGVADGESWLNNWPIRGRTSYPLLFDRDGKTKPAFDAVVKLNQ